jgi:uncharacterized protein YneF (UPF0154 family)
MILPLISQFVTSFFWPLGKSVSQGSLRHTDCKHKQAQASIMRHLPLQLVCVLCCIFVQLVAACFFVRFHSLMFAKNLHNDPPSNALAIKCMG